MRPPTRRSALLALAAASTGYPGLALATSPPHSTASPRPGPGATSTPARPAARTAAGASTLDPHVPREVARALRASGLPAGSWGIEIQAVDASEPLVSLNAEGVMPLASTAKLVTSAAALDLLGPDFHWETLAYLDGPLIDGQLHGHLVIVGGGDPLLTTEHLKAWLQRMRSAGLRHIRGDIVLDRSAFQLRPEDHEGTPEPGADRPHHVRPDALVLDQGAVRLSPRKASPGHSASGAGWVPQVPLADTQWIRTAEATSPGLTADEPGTEPCAVRLSWSDASADAKVSSAGARGTPSARADRKARPAPNRHLMISPQPPDCGTPGPILAVPPPGVDLFAQVVAGLWRSVGGRLGGRVRLGSAGRAQDGLRLPPLGADGTAREPWMRWVSPPLTQVLREINKNSDNLSARHLMLAMSPGFPTRAAALPLAQQRVRQWLQQRGFADDALQLDNGSGLSRGDRGQPQALVRLLRETALSRHAQAFATSLPVAGMDGTLANRFDGGMARGNALMKTGSLMDARALAGYVMTRQGKVYAAALLVHHPRAELGRAALDGIVEWLARNG